MGLVAESGGGGGERGEKKEREEGKFPLCESIGHWPLRGRCPKGKNQNETEQEQEQNISCS